MSTKDAPGLLAYIKFKDRKLREVDLKPGSKVGIDASIWIYAAIYIEYHDGGKGFLKYNKDTGKMSRRSDVVITYFFERIKALKKLGWEPFIVFDGCPQPLKARCDRKKRVGVGPFFGVIGDLIQVLRHHDLSFCVAPYEADPQLSYLESKKHIHAVITEDSDAIAYGCSRVFYKMRWDTREQEWLCDEYNKPPAFTDDDVLEGFSMDQIICTTLLSGSNYTTTKIPYVGPIRAAELMKEYPDMKQFVLKYERKKTKKR